MRASALFVPMVLLLLSGCATTSLQGIPQGLTSTDKTTLGGNDVGASLKIAAALSDKYESARNENLQYIYWSNVPLIPLGIAAAGALYYGAHRDVLAGIGLAAGGLAAFNTFTNARANVTAYASGLNALGCLRGRLLSYVGKDNDANTLAKDATALLGAIANAEASLSAYSGLLSSADAAAEVKADPRVVTPYLTNLELLKTVVGEAKKVATAADKEAVAFRGLPVFLDANIREIDRKVAAKITLNPQSFDAVKTSVTTSIGTATGTPASPPKGDPTPPKAPQVKKAPGKKDVVEKPAPSPVKDATQVLATHVTALQGATAPLRDKVNRFPLSQRQEEVETCVKNI